MATMNGDDDSGRVVGIEQTIRPETARRLAPEAVAPTGLVELLRAPGADWFDSEPPARDWLLDRPDGRGGREGFIPGGKVGLLVAPGGTGKTQALTQLALTLAVPELPWFGQFHATNPGRVALLLAEEDADEIRRRLYQAAKALRAGQREWIEPHLVIGPMAGVNVGLVDERGESTGWHGELAAHLRATADPANPWRAIILDPWSRWGGPNVETDNYQATRAVEALEQLTQIPGSPAVLVAHHTSKAAGSAAESGQGDARGASALVDGARWVANLRATGEDKRRVTLAVTKTNYTARPPDLELEIDRFGVLRPVGPVARAATADGNVPVTQGL